MKFLKLTTISLLVLLSVFLTFIFLLAKQFGYSPRLLLNTLSQAYKQKNDLPANINFLILGVDQRQDWLENSLDSDTIIFAGLNTDNLNLNLISLPRDLWFKPTSSRINKIYQLSFEQPDPSDFIKSSFQALIGVAIDHVIVIDTQVFIPLVKVIGSLEIYLEHGFTDDQYPDPNHITDPQNYPNPYTTISFNQGLNTIDEQNILYFVRSRKGSQSTDLGGTDIGRSQSQQLLIEAIIQKLKKINSTDFALIADLYQIWSQQIQKDIEDQIILSIAFKNKLNINKLNIISTSLPIQDNLVGTIGVIYHPLYFSNNAWVYLPVETDYTSIHHFVDQQIN